MSVFDDVRTLNFEDVVQYYGINVDRNHQCLCPFHQDAHPSMKIYPDHGYCFACGEHTDSVKLVARLFSLSPMEAAQRIAHDFGLTSGYVDQNLIRRQKTLQQNAENVKKGVDRAHGLMIRYLWCLKKMISQYAPTSRKQKLDERFLWAIHNIEYVNFLLDEYYERSDAQRTQICAQITRELIDNGYIAQIKAVLGGMQNGKN